MACAARRSATYWESDSSVQPFRRSSSVGVIVSICSRFGDVPIHGGNPAINKPPQVLCPSPSVDAARAARASSCQAARGRDRCGRHDHAGTSMEG